MKARNKVAFLKQLFKLGIYILVMQFSDLKEDHFHKIEWAFCIQQ